jgi:two-component system, chemotaxis family, protein-glutamate methylesterase/glutaminase
VKQRVSIATASGFLAVVIRKALARSPRLEPWSDQRDAAAALAAVREPGSLAIVDAELLLEGTDGTALRRELVARRGPSIVIDARQRGVAAEIAAMPSIVVMRGRLGGELDVAMIESELLAAVGSALRKRGSGATEPAPIAEAMAGAAASPERIELYDVRLELIVLGVSTGGPTLLQQILAEVTEPAIPMLIVQHMPESETAGFAARLAEESGLRVREVAVGPLPAAGTIGVVRGGNDVRIIRRGDALQLRAAVLEGNLFHPNIDEVLRSAVAADVAIGAAILTGMGQDGAAGALAMAQKGLPVIAQRPDTCAVGGMPQAAIDNGAARAVQSPEGIARTVNRWSEFARRGAAAAGSRSQP